MDTSAPQTIRLQPADLQAKVLGNLLQRLQAGQIVQARVLTDSLRAGDAVQLRLAGETLELRLPLAVRTGDSLRMQVTAVNPRLELALLREAPAPQPSTPQSPLQSTRQSPLPHTPQAILSTFLRQWAPQQSGQAPLLASLHALNQPGQAGAAGLPEPLAQALQRLWQALPTPSQIGTPEGLRQAMLGSGLFYEARLAHPAPSARTDLPQDLKARLLSLAEQLRALPLQPRTQLPRGGPATAELPPPLPNTSPTAQPRAPATASAALLPASLLLDTLRQQVERSLARLVIHQLSSTEKPDEVSQPRWLLELALRAEQGIDIIHMRLERDARQGQGDDEQAHTWKADLAMDLPELGPVHVRIVVRGQDVSTHFRVDSEETRQRLEDALPQLKGNLESRNLQVHSLNCRTGTPPDIPPTAADGPWIDSHA
ncbi:flagellar hook-length control protein FliK [Ectothiorhodospira lacustris]|uniref:flagellar hook-length control protein FliK n=1 Tax=Ectothiorhodospira lacustris TaxID=2899127 RepID=UPI001EE98017|nr:flagellar hook-length control protein FliK [Ectothiorhodospira lacustris]MCG5511078.1 flagellar hook-length control protein FliK [Ectothiorhodospira lacustris]MCG5522914.1 flagellar hook-length control protein FliK [Ectothiorhodospira lacustris]